MIVTLTVNPALDRTITLRDALRPGEVQTAASAREDAGGKGINVSRVVSAAGVRTRAVLPLAADDPFRATLNAAGLAVRPVPVERLARTNLAITDPAGVTTKLNLPGAPLTLADADAMLSAVVETSADADWLVLAGSLPDTLDDMFYADVVRAVRDRWGTRAPKVAVDASGPALRNVVEHAAVDLIKPNDEELADLVGGPIDQNDLDGAVAAVARGIVPGRVAAALVTLGGAGAVLVTADGAWCAAAPRIRVVSTVGAGDSSLAGYLLADLAGEQPADRLRSAIRYGAAAASLPGTQVPSSADLGDDDIIVRSL